MKYENLGPRGNFWVAQRSDLEKTLIELGWGLFFIWIGIAVLTGVGTGISLLGVGIIILSLQIVRALAKLRIDRFWLVVSLLLFTIGFSELFHWTLFLFPILMILGGSWLCLKGLIGERVGA